MGNKNNSNSNNTLSKKNKALSQMMKWEREIKATNDDIEKCNNILSHAADLSSSVQALRSMVDSLGAQVYEAIKENSRGSQQAAEKCSTISNQVASLETEVNIRLNELNRNLSSQQIQYNHWSSIYYSL